METCVGTWPRGKCRPAWVPAALRDLSRETCHSRGLAQSDTGPGRKSVTSDWQGDEAGGWDTTSQSLQAPPRVLVTRTCALGPLCWVLHVYWCSGAMQGTLGSFSQGNGAATEDQECYKEP